MPLDAQTSQTLLTAARTAARAAHCPYSRFHVGAALLTEDGRLVTGCNIENASYGLTICAERVAVFSAVAAGSGPLRLRAIAVSCVDAPADGPAIHRMPCGACRQVLWDLCGDLEVILFNLEGKRETLRLSELLPRAFDATFLD